MPCLRLTAPTGTHGAARTTGESPTRLSGTLGWLRWASQGHAGRHSGSVGSAAHGFYAQAVLPGLLEQQLRRRCTGSCGPDRPAVPSACLPSADQPTAQKRHPPPDRGHCERAGHLPTAGGGGKP